MNYFLVNNNLKEICCSLARWAGGKLRINNNLKKHDASNYTSIIQTKKT